ncbi:MAG: uracil-DNA glycosylase family protein [Candidatus Micrarchaeota archaeon]
MATLENIWRQVDNCPACQASKNSLQHVHGGGQENKPRFALVFINPTYNNISTQPQWRGKRYPFIGTRAVWRVLVKSGLLPVSVLQLTEGKWSEETAVQVEKIMQESGIYLTNVVKCTAPHGDAPSVETIRDKLPLLIEELEIVQPQLTIAMGLIPFKALTGESVKLGEFTKKFAVKPKFFPSPAGKVVPCWFPIGRGNPKKAIQLLKAISANV